jgi:membrane protein implicated in regulation of membrane protease activity
LMRRFLRDNGLTLVLLLMFAASLLGMWLTGSRNHDQDLARHGQPPLGLLAYAASGQFVSAVFENWESEFLQMAAYVVLTAMLFQRGSAESKDPDEAEESVSVTPDSPWPVRKGGVWLALYQRSLGIALGLLFLGSFIQHWLGTWRASNQEAALHGERLKSFLETLGEAGFWFESFQNWQSEFLSTAALVVLSIMLRQRNSPESKPVEAPHAKTGA